MREVTGTQRPGDIRFGKARTGQPLSFRPLSPLRPLLHPSGWGLLTASIVLAAALYGLPALQRWEGAALPVLLAGCVAYGAVAAIVALWPVAVEPPLAEVLALRKRLVAGSPPGGPPDPAGGQTELQRLHAQVVAALDTEVVPALRHLLAQRALLQSQIGRHRSARGDGPDDPVRELLGTRLAECETRMEGYLRRAAEAEGKLVALIEDEAGRASAGSLERWEAALDLYRTIAQELDGRTGRRTEESLPVDEGAGFIAPEGFEAQVQAALRQMNDPAALSKSALLQTLASAKAPFLAVQAEATPLEAARLLHQQLHAAIARLNFEPAAATSRAQASLLYDILHELYELRMSTGYIMARHSIGEGTLHRHRRAAVAAVARDLYAQAGFGKG